MWYSHKKRKRRATKSPFGGEIMPMKDVMQLQKRINKKESQEWQHFSKNFEEMDEIWANSVKNTNNSAKK